MKYHWLSLCLLGTLSTCATASDDWEPTQVELFCGKPAFSSFLHRNDQTQAYYTEQLAEGIDPDIPENQDCISTDFRRESEEYAEYIHNAYKNMHFKGSRLGPTVTGSTDQPVRRIYVPSSYDGIMTTVKSVNYCTETLSSIQVKPYTELYAMERFRLWAHELFHPVQDFMPTYQAYCSDYEPGKWLSEGSADAMSVYLLKQKGFNFRPPLARQGSRSFYGLRPYNQNLAVVDESKDIYGNSILTQYRTNSFFAFMSERYHGGKMDYLARYFKNKPVGSPGNYDWLKWIDQVLKKDAEVKKLTTGGLHLIFPEFLTHYATWGEKKHAHIGDKKWISESFGGCHTVQLNPTSKPQKLDVELEPLSGKCIDVKVTGLSPDNLTSLTVLALDKNMQALENIHLGMVSTTANIIGFPFKETYNCFDAIKTSAQGSCLEKPYQGPHQLRADGRYPKLWQPHVLKNQSGSYTTRFMLAHSPVSPSDNEHANRDKHTVHLEIGLDVSQLKTSVPDAGPVKRTQGRVHNPVGASDGGLGNIPIKGGEATTPLNILTNPEAMSQMFFRMNALPGQDMLASAYQSTGLSNIGLDQVDIPAEPGEDELIVKASFNIQLMPGIRFDSKGVFKGLATGVIAGRNGPDAVLYPWPVKHMETDTLPDNGRVEVIEYSKDLIHLKLDGTVCKWENLVRDAQGTVVACRKTDSFSGVIKKPFGWLYDPEQTFTSADTPSMQIYRQDLSNALSGMGMFPGMPPNHDPDASAADDGKNTDTDSKLMLPPETYQCQCSCEEMKQMQAASATMDEHAAAPPPELMQMVQCMGQCMSQYMRCNTD